MTWFRLDDTWLTHPKVQSAGLKGRALWVAGGLHCAQHLTDGRIAKTMVPALAALSGVGTGRKEAEHLVAVGLWIDQDDAYLMHDWHDYQPSRFDVEAIKEKRAEASAVGNHKRWHEGKGVRNPDCPYCIPSTSQTGSQGGSHARNPPVPDPYPTPPLLTVVPTTTTCRGDEPPVVEESIQTIAAYQSEIAKGSGVVPRTTWAAYAKGIAKRIRNEDLERIVDLVDQHPDWTAKQIADAYDRPEPLTSYDTGGGLL